MKHNFIFHRSGALRVNSLVSLQPSHLHLKLLVLGLHHLILPLKFLLVLELSRQLVNLLLLSLNKLCRIALIKRVRLVFFQAFGAELWNVLQSLTLLFWFRSYRALERWHHSIGETVPTIGRSLSLWWRSKGIVRLLLDFLGTLPPALSLTLVQPLIDLLWQTAIELVSTGSETVIILALLLRHGEKVVLLFPKLLLCIHESIHRNLILDLERSSDFRLNSVSRRIKPPILSGDSRVFSPVGDGPKTECQDGIVRRIDRISFCLLVHSFF